jgi:arsenate reductase-like glutaredoxin family protein
VQSASKEPVTAETALDLLQGIDEMLVAKGQKIDRFDLRQGRPGDDELLALLLGRSGKLRAPTIRAGKRLLVGYNQEMVATLL